MLRSRPPGRYRVSGNSCWVSCGSGTEPLDFSGHNQRTESLPGSWRAIPHPEFILSVDFTPSPLRVAFAAPYGLIGRFGGVTNNRGASRHDLPHLVAGSFHSPHRCCSSPPCAAIMRARRAWRQPYGSAVSRLPRPEKAAAPPTAAIVPAPPPISLVLVDDSQVLREGLAAIIGAKPGFKVVAAAADGAEVLEKVRETKPDVVLLDLGLADDDGVAMTKRVHSEAPAAKVIVMGLLPAQEDVTAYVRAGASGFIMKDASLEEFFTTIRAVAGGTEVLPKALTNSLFSQIARGAALEPGGRIHEGVQLTARERQVIALIGAGRTNEEIAVQLEIPSPTVKGHAHNVLEKLALHRRLEEEPIPGPETHGEAIAP